MNGRRESPIVSAMVVPWPATLRTRRLILRPYVASDHAAWLAGFTLRLPPRHRHDGAPLEEGEMPPRAFRSLCARHRRLWTLDQVYVFGVFDRKTGAHLGHVDLGVVERRQTQRANLGYSIHNTRQRRGYATEACVAAIRFAFRELGLHRLEAVIDPDNLPSIRLARRVGMAKAGLRPSFFFQDGRWDDQVIYEAVAGDWKGPRRSARKRAARRR